LEARKENNHESHKKRYEKIRILVTRFIENIRNAVWIRKEAEKVRAEQSKQDHARNMYTKNLNNRKIPQALSNTPQSFQQLGTEDRNSAERTL
jgi:hypothetical protein